MNNSITLAITDHVPLAEKDRYEALVEELHQLFKVQAGFLSVDIVRHNRSHQVEYTILSRWSNEAAAANWQQDKIIRFKLSQVEAITGGTVQVVQATGLGMWIDHAEGVPPNLPPTWKRITMNVLAVYPMLLLLTALGAPIIGGLPKALQILVIVIVLSALITWPIMPSLNKVLRTWLMTK